MTTDRTARYPDLAGRTVFVSGGASGIGAAFVAQFAAQGCRVAFVDIDDAAGAGARRAGSAPASVRYTHCDVRDVAALKRAIARRRDRVGRGPRAGQQRGARRPARAGRRHAGVLGRRTSRSTCATTSSRRRRWRRGWPPRAAARSSTWARSRGCAAARRWRLHDGEGGDLGHDARARARARATATSASTRSCPARSPPSASARCGRRPADEQRVPRPAVPQVPAVGRRRRARGAVPRVRRGARRSPGRT